MPQRDNDRKFFSENSGKAYFRKYSIYVKPKVMLYYYLFIAVVKESLL